MAHVFIVDENTLPIHLKYKFAGTGAEDYRCDHLRDNSVEIHSSRERPLTEMIADISRIKKGDKVIFYLQRSGNNGGKFFGSFEVEEEPFLCNDDYLKKDLGKNLIFRVKIVPDKVFSQGVTERECLDSLKGIEHPSQMCWSLIYRKLKAKRGCTMITNYEYGQMMKKIEAKNNGNYIESDDFDYDKRNDKIIGSNEKNEYTGKKESLNIKDRLIYKKKRGNACEVHLQTYILQNLTDINCLKVNKDKITWIGNEVFCGVGMQSIDICFIQENEKEANIVICELKYKQPKIYIKEQLEKYVEWIKDYIVPTYNKKVILNPIIIAPKPTNITMEMYKGIKNKLEETSNKVTIKNIKYISFIEENNEIIFKEVSDE